MWRNFPPEANVASLRRLPTSAGRVSRKAHLGGARSANVFFSYNQKLPGQKRGINSPNDPLFWGSEPQLEGFWPRFVLKQTKEVWSSWEVRATLPGGDVSFAFMDMELHVIGTADGNGGTHFSGDRVSPSWLHSCLNFKLFHCSEGGKKSCWTCERAGRPEVRAEGLSQAQWETMDIVGISAALQTVLTELKSQKEGKTKPLGLVTEIRLKVWLMPVSLSPLNQWMNKLKRWVSSNISNNIWYLGTNK